MSHTSTPWKAQPTLGGEWLVTDEDGGRIYLTKSKEKAEFIVRAANSHDELLNVAHMIADYCFMEAGAWKEGDPIGAVYRAAVSAIANAQPKEGSES